MNKIVGYSYWGFLSDYKLDKDGNTLSTPDGNAAYSWSIINALQNRGYTVIAPFPNRDANTYKHMQDLGFSSWAKNLRDISYNKMKFCEFPEKFNDVTMDQVFKVWDSVGLNNSQFILHEWRMKIPNRNLLNERHLENWQPDLFLQECIVEYCKKNNIRLLIFDLDYHLTEEQVQVLPPNYAIVDIGAKWKKYPQYNSIQVSIPCDLSFDNEFPIINNPTVNMVYVGNRYERDWCIDKYIPENQEGITIYGNWKEGGRDSENRWPLLNFGNRIQQKDMYRVYSNAICTILLAKHNYLEHNFMTVRLGEALNYGTVPLFIEEYGKAFIKKYAGYYADLITVHNKDDVIKVIEYFKQNPDERKKVIKYLTKKVSSIMNPEVFVDYIIGNK